MRYPLMLLAFIITCYEAIAQNESAHWFLNGSRAVVSTSGISNGTPAVSTPAFQPKEVSTSVSDANGNLLFASDGNTIIDKNLNVMPALVGDTMAGANEILTVKIPGSDKYYVFYTIADNYLNISWTLYYAIVDLSLNNGLGDVTSFDNLIDTMVSQGFTMVRDSASEDAWLIVHKVGTAGFRSYKITSTGLDLNYVASSPGTVATVFDYKFRDLKTSPNGKMIGGYCYSRHDGPFAETFNFIEIFNFDYNTAQLTYKIRTIRSREYYFHNYSVEFSPDNRLFYTSRTARIWGLQAPTMGVSELYQYNLCYTDSLDFFKFSQRIGYEFRLWYTITWGRVQMGADKNLYMPFTGNVISSVQNPNRIGTSANYEFDTHQVSASNNGQVGTPSFNHKQLDKAVKNNIVYTGGCHPNPTSFKITNDTIASVHWNFGDPNSASNTSTIHAPQHVFSAPGFYTVKAEIFSSSGALIDTLSELVEIKDPGKRLLDGYPQDTTFCQGGGIKLKLNVVNGIFSWLVRNPSGILYRLETADSFQINYSGTVYVEMRQNDCNGCIMMDSIKVTVLDIPNVNLGIDKNLCEGDSLHLQVYGSANYLWSTGETGNSIWVHQGGIYWVEGEINNNGCKVRDSVTITSVPGVQFALPPDTTLCNNSTLLLDPGVPNASYTWQDGSNNTSYTVIQPGTYWVRIRNNNFCQKTDTIHVAYVNAQQVSLGNDTTLCVGDSLRLQVNAPGAQFLWSTGSVSNTITVRQPGTYWLRVDNGSCTVADTIEVSFFTPLAVQIGNDTSLCEKEKLVLHATTPNATYLWSDGSTADSLVVSAAGTYSVAVNQNGCVVANEITISYLPLPTINLGSDTAVCANTSLLLDAAHASIQHYLWQDGSTQSSKNITTGGSYWLKATGWNGCINTDTIVVTENPLPVFNLGTDTLLCEGTSLEYNFSLPGATYLWNTGSTSPALTLEQPGNYWLQVTQGGCSLRDSLVLVYKPMPLVSLGSDTSLCEGETLSLAAFNAGAQYQWSTGNATDRISVDRPGLYFVSVNLDGCEARDTIDVSYKLLPRFTLGADTLICNGQTILLDPRVNNAGYLWQDGSTSSSYLVSQAGIYSVQIQNECGATSDEVVITKGICQLHMPNAFTPNNDGLNDLFRVKYPQFIHVFKMQVFNRWGEVVFSTTDAGRGWDGSYKGKKQPIGNYLWMISLTDLDGNSSSYKGSVLLLY